MRDFLRHDHAPLRGSPRATRAAPAGCSCARHCRHCSSARAHWRWRSFWRGVSAAFMADSCRRLLTGPPKALSSARSRAHRSRSARARRAARRDPRSGGSLWREKISHAPSGATIASPCPPAPSPSPLRSGAYLNPCGRITSAGRAVRSSRRRWVRRRCARARRPAANGRRGSGCSRR